MHAPHDLRFAALLILDTVGILASVYGYATWSYIGGGFGVGIHNTLEACDVRTSGGLRSQLRKIQGAAIW